MSIYDELISKGATEQEARDAILEDHSQILGELKNKGATDKELFDVMKESTGLDIASIKPDTKENISEYPKFDAVSYFTKPKETEYDLVNKAFNSKINLVENNYKDKLKELDSIKGTPEYKKRLDSLNALYDSTKAKLTTDFNKEISKYPIPTVEKQGLEYPAVSPEFGIVGGIAGGAKGAVSSVAGDIGAEGSSKAFDALVQYTTPEFKEKNPTLYALANLGVSVLGGGIASKGVNIGVEKSPAVLSSGMDKAYNVLFAKSTPDEALDYIIKRTGETPESVNSMYDKYASAIRKSTDTLTTEDKVNAILANSKAGAKIKMDAEYYNTGVLGKLNQAEETKRQIFQNVSKDGSLVSPAFKLKEYLEDTSGLFGTAKNYLIDNFQNRIQPKQEDIDNLKEVISQSTTNVNSEMAGRILNMLETKKDLGIDDLIAMKQDLNSMDLKSTKAFKSGQVGGLIDSYAKQLLGEDSYSIWKEVNKRYAAKKLIEDNNPVAKELMSMLNGENSLGVVSKKILEDNKSGYKWFSQIKQAIGEEDASILEKGMINEMLKDPNMNMANVIDNVKKFDFMTLEGKQLKNAITQVEGMTSKDEAIDLLTRATGIKQAPNNIATDVLSKFNMLLVGKIFNNLMARTPFETEQRQLKAVGDILKNDKVQIGELKFTKDELRQLNFEDEIANIKDKINSLKAKGKERTAAENKNLMDLENQQRMLGKELVPFSYPTKEYNPKAKSNKTEEIIDTEATRNYTKSSDGYYYDEFGNKYNSPEEIPSATTPLPIMIENKSSAKQPINITKESAPINKDAYKEEMIQESYSKGFKSSQQIREEKMQGKELVPNEPKAKTPKGLTEEQSARYDSIMNETINPLKKEIKRLETEIGGIKNLNTSGAKKDAMRKDLTQQLRTRSAELTTAMKKLPKK